MTKASALCRDGHNLVPNRHRTGFVCSRGCGAIYPPRATPEEVRHLLDDIERNAPPPDPNYDPEEGIREWLS